jgi:hypothetical protein
MDKETTEKPQFTNAATKAAYMDGYNRGESDGREGRGYSTALSETIHDALDWNRATGYDAGFADQAGV